MINSPLIGTTTSVDNVTVDRSQVRLFAEVIGLTDPRHTDIDEAIKAGQPDLLVPPTFLFGLGTHTVYSLLDKLGVDLGKVVHAGQKFEFFDSIHVGEGLTVTTVLEDTYEKKGGALGFIVKRSDVTRDGHLVQVMTETLAVRNDLEATK